ncbi:M20 family metallopeptidase [Candidatus Sodalis sp. SoCistrobi]|uniref:M20 family metallopeptidase n=1 Tax=Candidatus Sodalis sp. SoCistrobi TaxID=1922216 RepID=UPI0020B63A0E|nr:M20 family metallopeptidase [Candidatus Sodalis sp. SoCistrobi]
MDASTPVATPTTSQPDSHTLEEVWSRVEASRAPFCALSDSIWATPELNYDEVQSSAQIAAMLQQQGFRIERGIAGIPTAMVGEAGQGGPVIAILGEYDARPGLSQEADVAEPRPVQAGGNGHGCGHNLLGSAALQAASAVKDFLAAHQLPGRVRFYGCPAEEGGSAKGFMVRAGVFDDVDIAISWHPNAFSGVIEANSLACNEINYHFSGRAAHASASPHLGRSALDAVELMNVGVNYLREHMPSSARIHYAVTDTGGHSPNVVQARATVRYLIRARELPALQQLVKRVDNIAAGAALMSETTVSSQVLSGDANLIGNGPLEARMQTHLELLGPPPFDDADRAYAARFKQTLSQDDLKSAYDRYGLAVDYQRPLCDFVLPLRRPYSDMVGSTDVGSVSWVVPTVQVYGATYAIGTPGHSWQLVAQGKAAVAHKGMIHAAKIMASTAVDLLQHPELIAQAKAEHRARLAGVEFINPIPEGVTPPFPDNE